MYVEWDRFVTLTGAQAEWGLRYRIYNAPSEVVLTDIQYKQWCSTSYIQQCSQWSCVDWRTIQAMMQYILHAAMLPVKLCWLTYNTSNDAVHLICSNAPCEVVLTDIQYKQWCSTSYMQQCSQWSCVDWRTIQAMMQYILYAAMLPVKLCWLTYNTSVDAVHLTCIILWNKKIDTFVKRKKKKNVYSL